MVLAIDFDGTVVENCFPQIGPMRKNADVVLRRLADDGHKLVLWTCRRDGLLIDALEYLRNLGVPIEAVNENVPGLSFDTSNKIFYDVLIDDRSLGGLPDDWGDIYSLIQRMMRS